MGEECRVLSLWLRVQCRVERSPVPSADATPHHPEQVFFPDEWEYSDIDY